MRKVDSNIVIELAIIVAVAISLISIGMVI